MLVEELEDILAEAEGDGVDDALFARMDPAEAALVRDALGHTAVPFGDGEDDPAVPGEPLDLDLDLDVDPEPDAGADPDLGAVEAAEREEEVARLAGEVESSRRTQTALRAYLDLLARP